MSRYRKIDVRLWGDSKVRQLSIPAPNGRDCFIYLLAARESVVLPGAIPAGKLSLSESLRWPPEAFLKAFEEVERLGLAVADWDARLVWVPKAIQHNPPENPNVANAWGRAYAELPDCQLRNRIGGAVEAFLKDRGEAFVEAFGKGFGKSGTGTGTGEAEQSPGLLALGEAKRSRKKKVTEEDPLVLEVFEHWKKATGKAKSALDEARRKVIKGRLGDGYSVADLKSSIDGYSSDPWHRGQNERKQEYLSLTLMLRDAEHVDKGVALRRRPAVVAGSLEQLVAQGRVLS